MHMADALVSPQVAGTMYLCSSVAMGYSINKIKKVDEDYKKIPIMGVMGAFIFASQMINYTIPGTGSSGHLCGGMLLSAILGPLHGFLSMIGVLLIQCLLFADGGLLALGCNIWNMAFYGCFIGAGVIWRLIMKRGISKKKIVTASLLGCILTLQMGAFSVVLETSASQITELPFITFISLMQPIHLAIGLVEGLITSAVLCFIYETRTDILWIPNKDIKEEKRYLSLNKVVLIFLVLSIFIGGGLSLFASKYPDGLEWSIEQITDSIELEGDMQETAEKIQNTTAVLPDYSLKNSDSTIGTSISGIIGGIVVIVVCVLGALLIKKVGRKQKCE
ncbi:MAG: cobalamin biosynthesis protein CbiM [Clostridium sp.]|nr:cobalamin biosynthesis protein CbiM [Clostridium sp.]